MSDILAVPEQGPEQGRDDTESSESSTAPVLLVTLEEEMYSGLSPKMQGLLEELVHLGRKSGICIPDEQRTIVLPAAPDINYLFPLRTDAREQ
ncbi:hypothetical protein ABZ135_32735 [Streptomyces sp. NPDC006339]|uniref:hypothetical protein n=1 Tax=Streptomyces sp. NPDC006339 TaxID=3156755 RepID=UPI0033B228DB